MYSNPQSGLAGQRGEICWAMGTLPFVFVLSEAQGPDRPESECRQTATHRIQADL